jgi:hypothetical protein
MKFKKIDNTPVSNEVVLHVEIFVKGKWIQDGEDSFNKAEAFNHLFNLADLNPLKSVRLIENDKVVKFLEGAHHVTPSPKSPEVQIKNRLQNQN